MRNKNGTYKYIPFKHSNFHGLVLLIVIMTLGAYLNYRFEPLQATISPCPDTGCVIFQVSKVQASEPILEPHGAPQYIVDKIKSLFGEDTQNMLTIIGTCENGTWDQTRTNTNRNGTKDWGLAQINDANSKLCKGLDFQGSWADNLECAHRVYKSQGLSAWSCSHTVGVTPFYLKGAK